MSYSNDLLLWSEVIVCLIYAHKRNQYSSYTRFSIEWTTTMNSMYSATMVTNRVHSSKIDTIDHKCMFFIIFYVFFLFFSTDSPEEQLNLLNIDNRQRSIPNRRRRLFDEMTIENSAIDWHMRVQCAVDDATIKRKKLANDDECLQRLTERICQARQLRSSINGIDQLKTNTFDDTNRHKHLLNFPPTNGSAWMAISSPNSIRRYYVVLKPITNNRNDIVM